MIPKRVKRIAERRRQILQICHGAMGKDDWRPCLQSRLASSILRNVPASGPALSKLIPGVLTGESAETFSRRLAGLAPEIVNEGVDDFSWDGDPEMHTVTCTDVFPVFEKNGTIFHEVTLDVFDGPASGDMLSVVLPGWKASQFAASAMKRVRSSDPAPYDLAGMYFGCLLHKREDGRVGMDEVDASSSEVKWNRSLMDTRASRCLLGLFRECDFCRAGRDECSSAYHEHPLSRGPCLACGNPSRYISSRGICWECIRQGNMPEKEQMEE